MPAKQKITSGRHVFIRPEDACSGRFCERKGHDKNMFFYLKQSVYIDAITVNDSTDMLWAHVRPFVRLYTSRRSNNDACMHKLDTFQIRYLLKPHTK